MGKKKPARPAPKAATADAGPFHTGLAGLTKLKLELAPDAPAAEPSPAATQAAPPDEAGDAGDAADAGSWLRAKLLVRHERKGRGGKTVTLLSGVDAERREDVARELARALGSGARVEGESIVLGGDLRARLRAWLEKQGARRVVAGS